MTAIKFGRYVPRTLREWDRAFAPLNAVVSETEGGGLVFSVEGLPSLPASQIGSGQFSPARISQASVLQHQQSLTIEWPQIIGTPTTLAGYGVSGFPVLSGSGSPEGVVTAPPGRLYANTSGGAGTTLYVKESGTGNTGWTAK